MVGLTSGAQPIESADGATALSVNGEIYNHRELEATLDPGTAFSTDSDCEVLLHLFRQRGADFLLSDSSGASPVCGMFAFAVYDEREDVFVVARDHVGIIPLYMGWGKDGSTWFASELKALQAECDHYEAFPPGHYYSGRANHDSKGAMRQFYNHRWFVDQARLKKDPNYLGKDMMQSFSMQDFLPTAKVDLKEFRKQLTDSVGRHLLSEVAYRRTAKQNAV